MSVGESTKRSTGKRFAPCVRWDPLVDQYLGTCFPHGKWEAMKAALATPPPSTCLRVNTLICSTQSVLEQLNNGTDATTPATVHPLVPSAILLPGLPQREGGIDYSAAGGKEVVITRKTGESVLRGAPVFAPGVLACSASISAGDLVAVTVAVEQPNSTFCGITRGSVVPDGSAEREAYYIGLGRACMSREEMFRLSSGIAVEMQQSVFPVPAPTAGLKGPTMFQNLPSIVAAMALKPAPGSRVLDMCASPGGKSTMLAQLMNDQGTVIALDRSHAKASQVTSLAQELGLTIIQAYKMDATTAVLEQDAPQHDPQPEMTQDQQQQHPEAEAAGAAKINARAARKHAAMLRRGALPPDAPSPNFVHPQQPPNEATPTGFPPESFDAVLLDAPCSALGLRPRLVQSATPLYLTQCGLYSRKLLDVAIRLVRPGGRVVYSTCTISPFENERNVRHVLDKYPQVHLVPAEPRVGGTGLFGKHPLGGLQHLQQQQPQEEQQQLEHEDSRRQRSSECWLSEEEAQVVQRFDPCLDTNGFFIAVLGKSRTLTTS